MSTDPTSTPQVHPLIEQAEVFDPEPNALFSEEMRQLVAFLKFPTRVACCHCGKNGKEMWTMRCEFRVMKMEAFVMVPSDTTLIAGSPVCEDHCMEPQRGVVSTEAPGREGGKEEGGEG